MDPTLAEMGNHLSDAMKILESGQLETAQDAERRRLSWRDIPGPLQGDGQNFVTILQLVQNLMHDDEDKQGHRRMQCVGEQGHMALLGHSLAAYISILDKQRVRKLTTRILSDTTLWLCRLFRYENGSAYYHEDERDGLLKVCRLVIHTRYDDYGTEGFSVFSVRAPVIYLSAACRSGLGEHLCTQLGLPLSSVCTVPCNTMFGSQHQMDVALLDKLIKEDIEAGKLPLLLVANAGTPGAGHTDKLSRLKELCAQYSVWLHVEGVNLATLVLGNVSSAVTAATKSDSMTLTPGPWLGLPAVPAATLYRHEDPALSLAAGLTSSHPVEKLRALPLWLSLQYLGHDGIVEKIQHASQLSQQLLAQLKTLASIKTSDVLDSEISLLEALSMVEDELSSPVVVFRFSQDTSSASSGGSAEGYSGGDRDVQDSLNRWLGEQLALLVPECGVDVVELEDEGVCVRFNPLMTAAALGTQQADVAALADKLAEMIPVLSSTLRLRHDFREEVLQYAVLTYIEDLSWAGLGAVRYEPKRTDVDEEKRQVEVEKVNAELLKKLKELDTELEFSTGPEFGEEKDCIFIGMVSEDLDVSVLVETIVSTGREIEESGKLLENMTEVVRKGILEAEQQLQKAAEEKLLEEGVLRQIPLVSSMLNWLSPIQSSVKGRTFDLAAGSLDSTEPVYSMKAQTVKEASPETPTSTAKRLAGQKLFRRSPESSEPCSETSSVCHLNESLKEAEVPQPLSGKTETPLELTQEVEPSDQRVPEGQEESDSIR
ncbi:pyridoxal-dependent decarboxylase domain-containing protein 1 isoform X3 [Pangasianodon hypophthalmus]|uniref:pyridoxal-dependent decarboxylase domain-containing protein 1 isoform X3 n=1 Tax=Pangasianodon hypophthalmus TaxID=310915 RepID=UPI00147A0815|nr:pyridoxal-dependent decarboxylase domain-containing protein 1 isoform X3 [Pangasianodon hypophthalmus]